MFFALVTATAVLASAAPDAQIEIRGKVLPLHIYGEHGEPVIVSSGDGGWVHLAPRVAEILSENGFFVVGFDAKAYLSAFTDGDRTLSVDDVPRDFRDLIDYARRPEGPRPILIGVSEGAGLSVLAATRDDNKRLIDGVVGLGLPDVNELGWRWRDAVIYLTKKAPDEPSFQVSAIIEKVSPLPLAAIHSTRDEFVPLPEIEALMNSARPPKKLWVLDARNHRFSGAEEELTRRLLEAIQWIRAERSPNPE